MADGSITPQFAGGIQPYFAQEAKPVERIAPVEAEAVKPTQAAPLTPPPPTDTSIPVNVGKPSEITLIGTPAITVATPPYIPPSSSGSGLGDILNDLLGLDDDDKKKAETIGTVVGVIGGVIGGILNGTGTAAPEQKTEAKAEPEKVDEKREEPKQKMGKPQKFLSVADPHITTADGGKYDNKKSGDFILAKSDSGDLVVQSRQEPIKGSTGVWQTQGAVKTDGNTVQFDAASKTVTINGKSYPFEAGKDIQLPGGGHVKMSKDKFDTGVPYDRLEIFTKDGDKINMLNIKRNGSQYLDISGTVSSDRDSGSVKGTVGAMDADTSSANDMVMRDGKTTSDLDAMLEDWRVGSGESILK